MSVVFSDNFDADTVGTRPSNWVNGLGLAGTFLVQTAGNISSPNGFGEASALPVADGDGCQYQGAAAHLQDSAISFSQVAQFTGTLGSGATGTGMGCALRGTGSGGSTTMYLFVLSYSIPLAGGFDIYRVVNNGYTQVGSIPFPLNYFHTASPRDIQNGDKFFVKCAIKGSVIYAKAWLSGDAEPTFFLPNTVTDTVITGLGYPGLRVCSSRGGDFVTADDFSVDDLSGVPSIHGNLATVYPSTTQQQEIYLCGVLSNWTNGTTFTISGGTGASVVSQTVVSPTAAYLKIITGSATGTLTISDGTLSLNITCSAGSVVAPNDPTIRNIGPMTLTSQEGMTITSGSGPRFTFPGDVARVRFNVGPVLVPPTIWWRTQEQGWTQAILQPPIDPVGRQVFGSYVTISPTYTNSTGNGIYSNIHQTEIEFACGQGGGFPGPTYDVWNDQLNAVRIAGYDLPGTNTMLATPALNQNVLFVIGDSITQSDLCLYTASGVTAGYEDQTVQAPPFGFAKLLADYLCFDFVQLGYGGTGIGTAGVGNVPATPASFGYCWAGQPYVPQVLPTLCVLNIGTNDGSVSSGDFRTDYASLLTKIRNMAPNCYIVAVNPYGQSRLADITAGCSGFANVAVFDGNLANLSGNDFSITPHFSPGGNAKYANWLSIQIGAQLQAWGVRSGLINANVTSVAAGAITDAAFTVPALGTGPATGVLQRLMHVWNKLCDGIVSKNPGTKKVNVKDRNGTLITSANYTTTAVADANDSVGPFS